MQRIEGKISWDERWHIDLPLVLGLFLICAVSLVVLWSAGGERTNLLIQQGVRVFVAFIAMYMVAQVSPTNMKRFSPHVFALGMVLLVLVLGVGFVGKGAQRWLDLGIIRFQPSEIMKLGVPMTVAWWLTRRPLPPRKRDLVAVTLIIALPVGLVLVQPDLGTAIMIALSGMVVVFLAGMNWRHIAVIGVGLAAAMPAAWMFFLHDYQKRRVLTLFDPWSDPLGAGYHTIQSIIAVGSGGMYGKGWLNGSQSQLEFIPERSTDFVFAVIAEEFGMIGAGLLIAAYLFLVGRGLFIAVYAKDTYSRLLAATLSVTFFFYVFVNIGMVVGILPVVGVPLPLISFGGTSMVTLLIGFGLLMSVHKRPNFLHPGI